MKTVDVSIIIINYNTLNLTKNCIQSIRNNTKNVSYEIILVDNASPDRSGDILEKWTSESTDIIFIKSNKNLGFGRANNLAYKQTSGKYIFLLNSDTILLNNAIKIFKDSMSALPEKYVCLGSPLLERDKKTIGPSSGEFPTIKKLVKQKFKRTLSHIGIIKSYQYKYHFEKPITIVDYVIGADLFIRREVIEKLGLFDNDFFMYSEETEMQFRYNKNGFISAIIKGPEIIHLTPKIEAGKEKYSCINRYLFYEGHFTYLKKRYSFIPYLLYRMFFFITNFHQPFITKGTIMQKIQFFLLIFGLKTIKH